MWKGFEAAQGYLIQSQMAWILAQLGATRARRLLPCLPNLNRRKDPDKLDEYPFPLRRKKDGE